MIASLSWIIIITLEEYFWECSSADSKVLGPGVRCKIGAEGTVMEICKSRTQSKSSTTRRQGLLRIAISTAPQLSGSDGSICPRAWLFIHPPGNKKGREIDKIGYTRVVSEQNRVPFFSRRGALTHVCKTPPIRVLAPEPTTPCVRAAPQTVFSVFDPSKQRQ